MDDFEDVIERGMREAMAFASRVRNEIEAAVRDGKQPISVMCSPDTRRGDIINVTREDEETGEEESKKVRVLAVLGGMTGWDPDTDEIYSICEAICFEVEEGDIVTEDEWRALYGDGTESPEEISSDAVESPESDEEQEDAPAPWDPHVCECGAERSLCESNQHLMGTHLNDCPE